MAAISRSGATECRLDPSSISMSASRASGRLMESDFTGPVNIGSEEMVTINQLAEMVMQIAGKKLAIRHIAGPLGVRGAIRTIA